MSEFYDKQILASQRGRCPLPYLLVSFFSILSGLQ
jgi:hypothetical protein